MSRAILAVLLIGLMIPLFCAASTASQITLVFDAIQVVVHSPAGVLPMEQGVGVSGLVQVQVQRPADKPGPTLLYLDGQPTLVSNDQAPRLSVDTTTLAEGPHQLNVETSTYDGVQLASASGVLLNVANLPGALHEKVAATALQPAPMFIKIYRTVVPHEMVWFNGREGDLEEHGFRGSGQIYITATDLFRHIGGSIVWGPSSNWIELHRKHLTIRIIPGSTRVYVNGEARSLAAPALRKADRTYVPVQSLCSLLGLPTQWNAAEGRLYVSLKP